MVDRLLFNKAFVNTHLASRLIRAGLIIVFLYAAFDSLLHPQNWVGYLPQFAKTIIAPTILLKFFSAYEIGLALWLLSGKYIKYAAGLSALTLVGIVVANFRLFAITFRDIAIALSATALMFLPEKK